MTMRNVSAHTSCRVKRPILSTVKRHIMRVDLLYSCVWISFLLEGSSKCTHKTYQFEIQWVYAGLQFVTERDSEHAHERRNYNVSSYAIPLPSMTSASLSGIRGKAHRRRVHR